MMRILPTVILAGLLAARGARAEMFQPDTKCSTVIAVMHGKDEVLIAAAVQFMTDAVFEIDTHIMLAGKTGMLESLSPARIEGIVKVGILSCNGFDDVAAKIGAFSAYTALRSSMKELTQAN